MMVNAVPNDLEAPRKMSLKSGSISKSFCLVVIFIIYEQQGQFSGIGDVKITSQWIIHYNYNFFG